MHRGECDRRVGKSGSKLSRGDPERLVKEFQPVCEDWEAPEGHARYQKKAQLESGLRPPGAAFTYL